MENSLHFRIKQNVALRSQFLLFGWKGRKYGDKQNRSFQESFMRKQMLLMKVQSEKGLSYPSITFAAM